MHFVSYSASLSNLGKFRLVLALSAITGVVHWSKEAFISRRGMSHAFPFVLWRVSSVIRLGVVQMLHRRYLRNSFISCDSRL